MGRKKVGPNIHVSLLGVSAMISATYNENNINNGNEKSRTEL